MAKEIKRTDIEAIIANVGGKENILAVTHCVTRLRFALKDPKLANVPALEELPFVKGCFVNVGQFQVVIGPEVASYYKALMEIANLNEANKEEVKQAARESMSSGGKIISHFAEIFIPLLPALIAGGLILGFRNVIGDIKFASLGDKSLVEVYPLVATIHSALWLIGEAIFHFLPVAIVWSTVRKMGGTQILGIVLGITLVSPQLMNSYGLGSQVPDVYDFGLFQIAKVGYQAQVIPSILAAMALVYIERFFTKIVPSFLHLVLVPICTILVAVFLAHTAIGPFGRMLGDGVAFVVKGALTGDFATIGSAIFGFFYAPLVITGIHQTTLAIDLQLIQNLGGTPLWPLIALSNIAQASAVLGIVFISKRLNEREISVPAAISAYLGVTEPAMYGINLRYKFPMISAMIGSAVAALISGSAGVKANGIGVGGLPGILSIQPMYWGVFAIAMLVAIVIPFVLSVVMYKYNERKGTLAVK